MRPEVPLSSRHAAVNASQVAFIREQWHQDDGDWCGVIDQLNALLREHPDVAELEQLADA